MLIDTHCHLNFKAFDGQVPQLVENAKEQGVQKIIIPGAKLSSSNKALQLANEYPGLFASAGIHPHHAQNFKKDSAEEISRKIKKLASKKAVVAIGECGFDYHKYKKTKYQNYQVTESFKDLQKKVFQAQINAALQLDIPLIIHNRKASKDLLTFIKKQEKGLRGVFHCFQGSDDLHNWALENNFYIGITGLVTLSKQMAEIVKKTPLKRLLIETDAPFLAPEKDGKRLNFPNKPENVKIVAQKIVSLKKVSFAEVAQQTTRNAENLFKLHTLND